MAKQIVFIFVEGGIVQHCSSTSEVEVIKIEVDKEMTPSLIKSLQDQILPEGEIKANISKSWADVLKDYIDEPVDVHAVHTDNEFRGFLESIREDTDGTFYGTVRDLDGDCMDIDVMQISIPEDEF